MPAFDDALRSRMRANLAAFPRQARTLDEAGRTPALAAAVAATVVANEAGEACFVITRRARALRRHSGQWALPGGRLDAGESEETAALRELAEEVGLARGPDDVLGRLDDYPTRSGFVITPVVVWGGATAELVPDPSEVAAVHRVPLALLDAPGALDRPRIPESDRPLLTLSLPPLGTRIHSPTAAILHQLHEVALAGRTTRVAHYDQPVFAWR